MPMIDDAAWQQARRVLRNGLTSNLHCSIASVDPDGRPHVTPIGSVVLAPEPGRGIFFDILNARLSRNVDAAPTICVLAVDSRKTVWLRALVSGRFTDPPGVQLDGTAGPRREATTAEIERFLGRVRPMHNTKGGRLLWDDLGTVRDLTFSSLSPVRLGAMTRNARGGDRRQRPGRSAP